MPLDFMAAENQKDIDENTPVFCLGESIHGALMDASAPRKDFPKTNKLSNYYADTSILFGEILPLVTEIEKAIKSKNLNSSDLKNLVKFLQSAYSKKLNVFIYCD
ncbi:hypothetical protein HBO04_07345 [Pseudomonas proteolytica]|uniref:hypothetical protein n=1 Tax=Pseudomonas proteolytica TaxID=219574 RepID=UPI001474B06D|nr:hypothetical protein [Pseudomonas proteolytica]NMY99927.1 hypothetical protein [Pseudomonas proteolytica]